MVRSFSMRLVYIAAAIAVGPVLAAGFACSSHGSEPSPQAEGGADAADAPDAADAGDAASALPYPLDQVCSPTSPADASVCRQCQYQRCCDSRARLFATDAGTALVSCIAQSGCNSDCISGCLADAPGENAHYLENYACVVNRCPTECSDQPDRPDTCVLCTESQCPQDSLACSLSRDCFLFQTCEAECLKDASCFSTCAARYPAGEKLRSRGLLCAMNRCAQECATK